MADKESATDISHTTQRARALFHVARALWHVDNQCTEIRTERLGQMTPGMVRVQTTYSGLSRGTERLVWNGAVPQSEWQRMRAPFQAGDFPFPVKYGYSAVGRVVAGPDAMLNRQVFALHPHQDTFLVPEKAVTDCSHIPARRATLAANMETVLNAHWDANTALGDNVAVVGGGIVGLLAAYLAARTTGGRTTLIDTNRQRRPLAEKLGCTFRLPDEVDGTFSTVFHASASAEGLDTALRIAGFEAHVIELSWYGDRPVTVQLGGAFHAKRLQLISSQVGYVARNQRARISHRQRLALAIELLDDPALDVLVSETVDFEDLPAALPAIFAASNADLPPVVRYAAERETA